MAQQLIGWWTMRPGGELIGWWTMRPGGQWHVVESQVDDRLVTRCGREMKLVLGDVSLISVAHLEARERPQVCRYCGWH